MPLDVGTVRSAVVAWGGGTPLPHAKLKIRHGWRIFSPRKRLERNPCAVLGARIIAESAFFAGTPAKMRP